MNMVPCLYIYIYYYMAAPILGPYIGALKLMGIKQLTSEWRYRKSIEHVVFLSFLHWSRVLLIYYAFSIWWIKWRILLVIFILLNLLQNKFVWPHLIHMLVYAYYSKWIGVGIGNYIRDIIGVIYKNKDRFYL